SGDASVSLCQPQVWNWDARLWRTASTWQGCFVGTRVTQNLFGNRKDTLLCTDVHLLYYETGG
ncbi:hypothetical protein, partial [Bacteroides congonensis]|uniref:hypothetical protein n=1 Tax=Bacteroides congonensis TaxID=1871006 RepID=UPI002659D943